MAMAQCQPRFAAMLAGVVVLGQGCSSTDTQGQAEHASPTIVTRLAALPATPSQPLMTAETRGTAPACAFVTLGFDRRALPTNTTPQGHASWLLGEADRLRRVAPAETPPRMYTDADSSNVHALFDGTTDADVLVRCTKTVTAYIQMAPMLPLLGLGSAVHVVSACRSCD
jgi:hypothetical protein